MLPRKVTGRSSIRTAQICKESQLTAGTALAKFARTSFLDFLARGTLQSDRGFAALKEPGFRMFETHVAGTPSPRSVRQERLRCLLKRTAILLLLLAVPALSTLAKTSWYLPQADAGHYLNGAIKMSVPHARFQADWEPPLPPMKILPPPAPIADLQPAQPKPSGPDIAITTCLRHRSPPFAIL
jgi:hypothetical protein